MRMYNRNKLYYEYVERFFKDVEEGRVYEYYYGHFMYRDVENLAKKYGVKIQYLPRDDPRRKGSYSFLVTQIRERVEIKRDPLMFDISELAI